MRARNKLNVKQVASFKNPGIYSDGGGLYLRVRKGGSRSWLFIYQMNNVRREMGLGSDLDVTLAKAREKAAAARQLVLDGVDPQKQRAAAKAHVPAPVVTFGDFASGLIETIEEGFSNQKHRQQWKSSLVTHAALLWDKPIDRIATEHILAALQPIWLSKAETASRVRGRIERILDAARVKGLRSGENPAAWRGHLQLLLPKQTKIKVKHHAALPLGEISGFMTDLAGRAAIAARALEFTILTAARSGETRGMTWGEIDFDARIWTVPAGRMKAGVEHQVPLSNAALSILTSVRPAEPSATRVVFPAPRGGQLSDMSLGALLKRMGRANATVHGFRSTFRDWVGEATDFSREDAEMALAHAIASATERAYRRGRALEKRRAMMEAWAAYCGR